LLHGLRRRAPAPLEQTHHVTTASHLYNWKQRRGGAHFFPTRRGLAYREYFCPVDGSEWGEGLLDKPRFGDPGVRSFHLPSWVDVSGEGEILLLGTGRIPAQECEINGQRLPLLTTGELNLGNDIYKWQGNSVHRCYHLVPVPAGVLVHGANHLKVAQGHAFIQGGAVRIFESAERDPGLTLAVAKVDGGIRLAVHGGDLSGIHKIELFARHEGPDLDLTGEDQSWQGVLSADPRYPSALVVRNHLANLRTPPWATILPESAWPSGPVSLRARVILRDGMVVESAGGVIEVPFQVSPRGRFIRPGGFKPFGFHANGWQQHLNLNCAFDLSSITGIISARLLVPCYGSVRLMLNGQHEFGTAVPIGDYYISILNVDLEHLRRGTMNTLLLRSAGTTGCFQPPGPCLLLDVSQPLS
jgi:hypothetical protein